MKVQRVHVWVAGRVQGVFFRQIAQRQAETLGLKGWIRNLSDGCVEATVEGQPEAVAAWVRWCRSGPEGAHVADLKITEEVPAGDSGFRVLPNYE